MIIWEAETRPAPKGWVLEDGEVMSLAPTGLPHRHVRREGDKMRFGKSK